MRHVSFVGNSAVEGGAVQVYDAPLTMESIRFERNAADSDGGALFAACTLDCAAQTVRILLTHVSFSSNAAARGGAIYLSGASLQA